VGGKIASDGPTITWTPTCKGIWLSEPDGARSVAIWGDDDASFGARDVAILHTPIGPDAEVSRRRLSRLPRSGTVSGLLIDVGDVYAHNSIASLDSLAESDAGEVFTLVLGDLTMNVIIGDVSSAPTSLDGEERYYEASFSWWERR
jgi:hypothetical protein